ncbi:helix-turn-helix domain-containing protein [Terrabacter sp. 2YAF2]|uniref:helix-turn-helix domain-containing protein n=1 Tax=Terrabacter sp. 2YAF2 TaxID=3233026 RepID=UPI003F9714E3
MSTAEEFAQLLTGVRERAGLSVREAAAKAGLPSASAGGYFAGRHLPPANRPEVLTALLEACGVCEEHAVTFWLEALRRAHHSRRARAREAAQASETSARVADPATANLDQSTREAARRLLLRLRLLERLGRLERAAATEGSGGGAGPSLRWEDLPAALSRHSPTVSSLAAAGLLTADDGGLTLTRPLGLHREPAPTAGNTDPDATRAGVRLVNRAADWRDDGQDPSHLLKGTLLAATLRWATPDIRKWLSHTELRFLAASEMAQAHEHATGSRRTRRSRLVRQVAVVTLVSATGWAAAAAAAASGAPR